LRQNSGTNYLRAKTILAGMDDPGGRQVAKVRDGAVLRPLRVLLQVGPVAGLSDGQLLERFLGADGEVAELAFAALVDRHGQMVRRICRRMLGDLHDSQDVFQATFFILARKARSVRRRESVASWLHGVAYRVCLRTRTATIRRRVHERAAATLALTDAPGPRAGESLELHGILHEELDRLAERFRAPIVLCDLQDLAYEEAAKLLGCPVGTVKSRLARGRERLRARLARRGVAPSSGILVGPVARASVPTTLRDATARAAIRLTMHGNPVVGTVSAGAIALTEGMLRPMIMFKLKVAASVLALVGLGTTALAVRAGSQPGEHTPSILCPMSADESMLVPVATVIVAQPSLARTQAAKFPQGPISKIEFEGNATITPDKIKPKLLSRVGQPLD
jgi:RNA polymerase sigma factor (sigma-70 family)